MKFRVEIETEDEPTAESIRAIVDVIPKATLTAFDPDYTETGDNPVNDDAR